MPHSRVHLFLALVSLSVASVAQQANSPAPAVDNAFVQAQFGPTCTLQPGSQPLVGDLDGDRVADLVIAAHCTNPLMDQSEHSFVVIDPYNSFYGYGNTRITTQFSTELPETRGNVLLIIHGSGAEAWHSATPKAKFVIVNLPYKQVYLRKLKVKKKSLVAIYAEESGSDEMTSTVFWDGKRYRYQPLGSSSE